MSKCFQTNYLKGEFFQEIVFQEQDRTETVLQIDDEKTYQEIIGFGGAFTESSAYLYQNTSDELRKKITDLYFNKESGLGYTLGRVVINSCDFSLGNYTYLSNENLSSFDLSHEDQFTIPMIEDAMKLEPSLTLMAAPWSPPPFMKTNNSMNYGGRLKEENYNAWADYLILYLQEMKKRGLNVSYLSIQNEPEANQVWDSCLYTPEETIRFIKVLGPKLNQTKDLSNVKIVALDHNRDLAVKWAKAFSLDDMAMHYTWGLGIHWYVSEDFSQIAKAKEIAPSLHFIFTEGCIEGGVRIGAVDTGERYARNMIGDFLHGMEGYLDWNLLLDEVGGPNHVGNYCDAPLLLKSGELIINSSYYYIGHFSKFVMPMAKRINLESNNTKLQTIAFKNPTGEIVVIICNPTEEDITYQIKNKEQTFTGNVIAHTIQTWRINHE